MPTNARVCHSTPGRLRIRIETRRRDDAFFHQLAESLARVPGVLRVDANPLTATVLVFHSLESAILVREIGARGCAFPSTDEPKLGAAEQIFNSSRPCAAVGLRAAGISADTRALAILALFGMAIHQAIEGNVMVPAVSLLWYAFNLLVRQEGPG